MVTTALALFSGGLDSLLSCRVVAAQGVRVVAIKFVSPFFDYGLLAREQEYQQEIKQKYDIDVVLRNISQEYIELVRNPVHGYGKHFNPCLDCKIFMMTRARQLMKEFDASFLISGEVVGQRPMSQRRDAMRVVERDSGCEGLLVRPLCAKRLDPTKPEIDGLLDRERLLDFSGRSRTGQMSLAEKFGFTDYPTPAGGCILTDPVVGERIKKYFNDYKTVAVEDMQLIKVGRQFILPLGSWLVVGRNQNENSVIEQFKKPGDYLLKLTDRPGPSALLKKYHGEEDLRSAAGLVARYAKKGKDGNPAAGEVAIHGDDKKQTLWSEPLPDQISREWLF